MKGLPKAKFTDEFPNLPQGLCKNLTLAADQAAVKRIAIVGGFVRDELSHLIHNESKHNFRDIDLVIEGSVKDFAMQLQKNLGKSNVIINRLNPSYLTIELKINDVAIDVARARIERYENLAENPKIAPSEINKDLFRRDFTINSIAFDLKSKELIDPYEGINSISEKKIEFIHDKSVSEDPTRVFRASRYSARLGFNLTPLAIKQIRSTIKTWPWHWTTQMPPENAPAALATRLRMELELLFDGTEQWRGALQQLQELGALILLDQELQNNKHWEQRISWAFKLGVSPLTAFIAGSSNPYCLGMRLQIPKKEQQLLIESKEIMDHFCSISLSENIEVWDPSRWCEEIESTNWKPESIAITICLMPSFWSFLLRWWEKWRLVKSKITAKDLLQTGWKSGPELGLELKRLRYIELKKK
ncbi:MULTISPECIES: CCA tRNA nucleotidyltransferase [Prochlorococcus]|uniref:tRNA nucleotidyltransferase/poly(A) polymerase n=1 Tax=Prochlorococcus marinus (strain SARG / CCMP1375 / SS120) TaxID=167539 RepID=Q7TVA9_PROMA|nr:MULTISPECIES: CCA tRNA nucleotidyltransferase [Prochlorococcus]AAP99380.1 tRNA nucleotidyltransferase/poly(A) polymerase [Prochlorococcus marinus subsp. marinus str. CCMP1375]KGG11349.1 tRNA nucleotidyltransferase [Prochlorococcus marinus str. LG]KGG18696.1 tRNA nucleotidyltransferase [Prochlorococcus marinus str. SS2]KGG22969.1 tRNA nucleotidyltransferase [Prochlorococcus marinus str. SS35]KGG34073.1 tRNA nucleotidyltransferase [Prochlorococcus marinus str. SS51]